MNQSGQHLLAGLALVTAYVLTASLNDSPLGSLWGSATPCLKRSIGVSMSVAALGFALVVWSLRGQETGGKQGWLFCAFAFASALWMPLAFWAMRDPDGPGAALVVLQLVLAASLAFAWALSMAELGTVPLAGAFLLAGNSMWMDLLVWPCVLPPRAAVGGGLS